MDCEGDRWLSAAVVVVLSCGVVWIEDEERRERGEELVKCKKTAVGLCAPAQISIQVVCEMLLLGELPYNIHERHPPIVSAEQPALRAGRKRIRARRQLASQRYHR